MLGVKGRHIKQTFAQRGNVVLLLGFFLYIFLFFIRFFLIKRLFDYILVNKTGIVLRTFA